MIGGEFPVVSRMFTPILVKHKEGFNVVDMLSVKVCRTQNNSQQMQH